MLYLASLHYLADCCVNKTFVFLTGLGQGLPMFMLPIIGFMIETQSKCLKDDEFRF